ncbi:unnamed protein product [Eruca vesicaria subsp. sativa]|uniref:MATH domain-containing protein n=1 Tax=Eruca vesicaria subsp. sativa TaxID=29727 RepID=A0ABC8KLC4_ERUVS|nr:unnamed protein product [Eruca vesicaria subsp. sativa]
MGSQVDSKFTWVIHNLPYFHSERIYSDSFEIGGCNWRLIAYPKSKWLNRLTLEVADAESIAIGWRRLANFSVTIVNQALEKIYRRQGHYF